MTKIYQWFDGARWRASLAHVLLALLCAPGLYVLGGALLALGVVSVFFYTREMMEWDFAKKVAGEHLSTVEAAGFNPLNWVRYPVSGGWYAIAEFAAPTLATLALVAAMRYWRLL